MLACSLADRCPSSPVFIPHPHSHPSVSSPVSIHHPHSHPSVSSLISIPWHRSKLKHLADVDGLDVLVFDEELLADQPNVQPTPLLAATEAVMADKSEV